MFRHEAVFYEGTDGFVETTLPFVREGVEAGEPVLVAAIEEHRAPLERALGSAAEHVFFGNMAEIGRNPARIIPVWEEFVAARGGSDRPIRGVGEPVWAGRRDDEIDECVRHEQLLNAAFAGTGEFTLICPYESDRLEDQVLAAACCSHPVLRNGAGPHESSEYHGSDFDPFAGDLPEPAAPAESIEVSLDELKAIRDLIEDRAWSTGVDAERVPDFVLAVNEAATNSITHGGGHGALRVWSEGGGFYCEVADSGRMTDPLVGRRIPLRDQIGGRGVWLVNQLCDLVQIRSGEAGTVVRMRVDL